MAKVFWCHGEGRFEIHKIVKVMVTTLVWQKELRAGSQEDSDLTPHFLTDLCAVDTSLLSHSFGKRRRLIVSPSRLINYESRLSEGFFFFRCVSNVNIKECLEILWDHLIASSYGMDEENKALKFEWNYKHFTALPHTPQPCGFPIVLILSEIAQGHTVRSGLSDSHWSLC